MTGCRGAAHRGVCAEEHVRRLSEGRITAPRHSFLTHSIQSYRGHGAAVHCLLAVTRVAGCGVSDPSLVVPELKNLRAKLCAESAADAKVHINFRSSHRCLPSCLN
jgi:hypothetical protein